MTTAELVRQYRMASIGAATWPRRPRAKRSTPTRGPQVAQASPRGARPGVWGRTAYGKKTALLLETAALLATPDGVVSTPDLAAALETQPNTISTAVAELVKRGRWPYRRPWEVEHERHA